MLKSLSDNICTYDLSPAYGRLIAGGGGVARVPCPPPAYRTPAQRGVIAVQKQEAR
jgi:hypothetical protein